MKLSLPTVLISLLLHGVLAMLLWLYAKPAQLPEPPKVMQAILMAAPTGASSASPKPEAPKPPPKSEQAPPVAPKPPEPPKPAPEPKAEPKPTPKPTPEPKPAPTKPTKASAEKPVKPDVVKPKPAIDIVDDELAAVSKEAQRLADEQNTLRKQREAEQRQKALADALQAEADALAADAANERARRMSAQIGEFQLAINRKIKANWRRPPAVSGKLVTELRITLLPGGEVASVLVVKSSGNNAFDESAKDAVSRANPLPVPSDPALFREQFKVLLLKFKPEE